MSTIDFNYQSAYEAKETVRIAAEAMVTEGKIVEGLIAQTTDGWTGAGADAYINYLNHILSEIRLSASRLYTILNNIDRSINAAYEADRLAKEAIESAVTASGGVTTHTSSSGHTHGGGGQSFEPAESVEGHGGAGRSIGTETSAPVEEVNAAIDAITNSILGTFGNKSHKRR